MTRPLFHHLMEQMYDVNEAWALWLEEIPYHQWTQAYDEGRRYGHMTTNLVESINSMLKRTRHLPITSLVQATYFKLLTTFAKRGRKAETMIRAGHKYSLWCQERLDEFDAHAKELTPRISNRTRLRASVADIEEYEGGRKDVNYRVMIDERWCDCGWFQAHRFPCAHVIAICNWAKMDFYQFVDPLYKIQTIFAVYENEFADVPERSYWRPFDEYNLIPDVNRRRKSKGRPQSRRIRNEMDEIEESHPKLCRNCALPGHDIRTCPIPPRENLPHRYRRADTSESQATTGRVQTHT